MDKPFRPIGEQIVVAAEGRANMNFYDAVYGITLDQGTSMEKLSIRLEKSPNYISASKGRGSLPKVDNAAMILDGLDYVLCAVPNEDVTGDRIAIE